MRDLLIAVILLPASLIAQKLPVNKAGRICFSEVIKAPGVSQQALRDKAINVITTYFSFGPDIKITTTPGSLLFKGYSFYHLNKIGVELPYYFHFTLSITFENGRYTYITTDFLDDENRPLETGLLHPRDIYDDKGEVKEERKEFFHNIGKGLIKPGEELKAKMKE